MSTFHISFDWVDFDGGADEPSLQATFAQIIISIDSCKVTRLLDRRARTTRDFATIPLYPVAEWVVANWWCIFEEAEVPSRGTSSHDYQGRHKLREGREGYAFPDVQFFPEGHWTLIKWAASRGTYQLVEFLENGQDRVHTQELREKLSDLIDAVIDRLESKGVRDTWLQSEWRAIREMGDEEREFCIAAGQLGLDPYQLDDRTSKSIIDFTQHLPRHIQEEVLKATPPQEIAASIRWVQAGLHAIQSNATADGKWASLRDRISFQTVDGLPWESGYALARQLRGHLQLADVLFVNINDLIGSPFPIVPVPTGMFSPKSFDGLIGFGTSSPCCYTAKARPDSERFLCARGLLGFLSDKSDHTDFYSSAQTNTQQCNRAFAAEFLAPAYLIQRQLSGDDISSEEVEELAAVFQVSTFVIDHQIRNHHLGKIASDLVRP